MAGYRGDNLTNGYLPVAAFVHLDATEIGMVDIDATATVTVPHHRPSECATRDGLLLVRLHGEPLSVIHLDGPIGDLSEEQLAAVLWQEAGEPIVAHARRYGCVEPPRSAADLLGGCGTPETACTGASFDMSYSPASVIVPTGGRPAQLERCLRSMLTLQRSGVDFLVIDNRPEVGDTKRVVETIADENLSVRYIAESRPGSSVARNRGLAETDAELVAFTDDDVVVDAGWLNWLLSPFADSEVTVATGMVLPLALEVEAQKRFEQYAGFSKGVTRRAFDLHAARADERVLYPYWGGVFGSGNSMAFRRAELVAAGGFDAALGAGSLALSGADIEAFSAAILRGGRLVYEPRALCWHEHRDTDEALQRQLFNYGAGFTAILTKYLLQEPRFVGALAHSVPIVLQRQLTRNGGHPESARLPKRYARLARSGMLRGPWLYGRSRRWARQLRLYQLLDEARSPPVGET